jgi:hypothetical protein
MSHIDEWIKTLLGYPLLCQMCGDDTKHGKGTGKAVTHRTSAGDSVCENCRDEFEAALEEGENEGTNT